MADNFLQRMYGKDAVIHDATVNVPVDGTINYGLGEQLETVIYPAGTAVSCFLDDPERPGMADVMLPNGKLVRMWASDVTLTVGARR